jgi:hypothetical protein
MYSQTPEEIAHSISLLKDDIQIRMRAMHYYLMQQGSAILERFVREIPPPATHEMNQELINLALQSKMHWDDIEDKICFPMSVVHRKYKEIDRLMRVKTP